MIQTNLLLLTNHFNPLVKLTFINTFMVVTTKHFEKGTAFVCNYKPLPYLKK